MDKRLERLWEERKKNFPRGYHGLSSESAEKYAEEMEEKEFQFLMEHSHGEIVLKSFSSWERSVKLSTKFRTWELGLEENPKAAVKHILVCKKCHKSLTIVDGNTPEELKSI